MQPDSFSLASSTWNEPKSSVEAAWAGCLAIADARRAGKPVSLPQRAGLLRTEGEGWGPDVDADPMVRALVTLIKPLLDQQPGARAWVIAQLGQSLDGCIATRTGDARYVNGPEILIHLHRLRALADAVIVGAGTVAIDDPQLTVRHVVGPNPVRVVFDPKLQLTRYVETARCFNDGQAQTLWLCDSQWHHTASALVGAQNVLSVPSLVGADGRPDVPAALAALHARGLKLLFVEGGGVTVSHFLAQSALDRLHLAIAPLIIGSGRPGLRFTGSESLVDCPRPSFTVIPMGQDQLWDLDLRGSSAAP